MTADTAPQAPPRPLPHPPGGEPGNARARVRPPAPGRAAAWPEVAALVLAASAGGYWVAWGSTAFLVLVLPMTRPDRVMAAGLAGFAVWVAAAMYAFAARSGARAWGWLLLLGAVLNALAYGLKGVAVRP
jgi:hypothetical protein